MTPPKTRLHLFLTFVFVLILYALRSIGNHPQVKAYYLAYARIIIKYLSAGKKVNKPLNKICLFILVTKFDL